MLSVLCKLIYVILATERIACGRSSLLSLFCNCLFALVFTACGEAAADMPLRLVEIQQHTHLAVKPEVHTRQPLGEILVYCGFADAEFFGGSAHGAPVFDDIHGQVTGPLL